MRLISLPGASRYLVVGGAKSREHRISVKSGRRTAVFEKQPLLSSDLLLLRPLCPHDFEELYAIAKDPLIWAQHPEPTRFERAVFERFFSAALACAGALVAIDPIAENIIGSSRFDHFDEKRGEV